MIRPSCDNDFASNVRQIAGATLAASISIGFAYTSLTLFLSNQSKYNRNFKKFQNAKRTCRVVHQPLPTNENKLVYFKGNIKPNDQISDDTFRFTLNLQDKQIIYLYRECEMYQWTECKSDPCNKYSKRWCSAYIDSGDFEEMQSHQNPSNMIPSKLFQTKHFTVSNFTFDLNDSESIIEPKQSIELILQHAKLLKQYEISLIALNDSIAKIRSDHSHYGWYYFARNDKGDTVGDIRVRFWVVTEPLPLTVIGTQNEQKISVLNEKKNDNVCMRCIGTFELDNALKKYFGVKLINRETGSVFVMTQIALGCFMYASQVFRFVWRKALNQPINGAQNMKTGGPAARKANEFGVGALVGTVSICGPAYCFGCLYPHIEILYGKHPVFMNFMCVLTAASIAVGPHYFMK
eukprot:325886_1